MKRVVVGIIGSGFSAGLHMEGYLKTFGIDVRLKAVAFNTSRDNAEAFSERYGVKPNIYDDWREMLKDGEIDVIDICTPPFLHEEMIIESMKAGKHVICEKPLTGFFGGGDGGNVGKTVKKSDMYKKVCERLENIKKTVEGSDNIFMYAENWIYAPVIQKSAQLIEAKKSKILFAHAEESHSGSHAFHAANWKFTGGGVLIRQGCHPLSAVLYLKQVEAKTRGEKIEPVSVLADCGVCVAALAQAERKYIDANPVDVEDIANITITFSDGTKAHIMSGDMILGGIRNCVDVYTNNSVHHCKMNPNDTMTVYHGDQDNLDGVYFAEKLGTKQGWQFIGIGEEIFRGYAGEIQDFMECVACQKKPLSDFKIAYDTAKIIYAAYQSAEEDKRVYL